MSLLFFVDESADAKYHFHLGLLANGAQVAAAEKDLEGIVERAFDAGLTTWRAEIHGEEIVSMKGAWAKGRTNISGLIDVAHEVLGVLAAHEIEVICRGVELDRFRRKYGPRASPHTWLFRNVLERLNERLKALDDYALVIADEHHQYGRSMRADLHIGQRVSTPGYRGQKLARVIDTVHFVNSADSRLTQLADMAVYVRRRRESGPENDPRFEAAMAQLGAKVFGAVAIPSGAMDTVWRP